MKRSILVLCGFLCLVPGAIALELDSFVNFMIWAMLGTILIHLGCEER